MTIWAPEGSHRSPMLGNLFDIFTAICSTIRKPAFPIRTELLLSRRDCLCEYHFTKRQYHLLLHIKEMTFSFGAHHNTTNTILFWNLILSFFFLVVFTRLGILPSIVFIILVSRMWPFRAANMLHCSCCKWLNLLSQPTEDWKLQQGLNHAPPSPNLTTGVKLWNFE